MKKYDGLLMICYYYPPIKSMGVMRSYALSHQWLKYFNRISVITTRNNQRLQSEHLPIDKLIHVKAMSTFDYRTVTSIFSSKSHYAESSKKSWLGRIAVKLLNSFPFNLWIGEGGYWYSRNVYRLAVRQIKNNGIRYIYSSFRPYSDHAIAARLKSKFPHLIWLADFRDIHIDALKQNVFFTAYQHRMNARILSKADAVTTVSHGCAEHILKYYPHTEVIYNGIDSKEEEVTSTLSEKFTISYTGSLYGEMRDPSLLFRALKELLTKGKFLAPIQIIYAGKDGDTWNKWINKYGLGAYSMNEGLCSHARSRELQASSHINLQLTFAHPKVTGAITGKVMEYVQTGRPILCIINGSRDKEIETFFNRVNESIVVYNDEKYLAEIVNYISKYYKLFESGDHEAFSINQPILEELDWSFLAEKFVEVFNRARNRRTRHTTDPEGIEP